MSFRLISTGIIGICGTLGGVGFMLKSNSDEKTLKPDIENTDKQKENKKSNNSETSEIVKETQIKEIIEKINKNDFTKSNVNEDEKILIAQHWIDIVPKVTNINFFQQMLWKQSFWKMTKEKEKICVGNIYEWLPSFNDAFQIPVLIDDLSPYTEYIFEIFYKNKPNRDFKIVFKKNAYRATSETISSKNTLLNSTKDQKYLIAKKILENFEKTIEALERLGLSKTTTEKVRYVFKLDTAHSCQVPN